MAKIGSGSYGEVFSPVNPRQDDVVYKIVPLDKKAGKHKVSQSSKSILSDLLITKCLHNLRYSFEKAPNYCENFPNIKRLSYVYSEADHLLTSDKSYKGRRKYSNYKYMIYEMIDGGITLSSVKALSPKEGIGICAQLLAAFTVAEVSLQFEHRDLHLSNILLSLTEERVLKYKVDNKPFEIPIFRWKVMIIDFTFARISIDDETAVFSDLSNLALNKLKVESLLQVYEKQKELCKGSWDKFYAKTNISWLEYAIGEVIKRIENYGRKTTGALDSLALSEYYRVLRSWKETISRYESSVSFAIATNLLD
ncbi:hypothetical protein B4U79_17327 [Dinothrombium tinctorium]|uniref:non-specific serine/threonine protein kinase n=1 Tax=Dinothrombium tinctorium TaxID=1965070 RepID=A0A443REW9_9ACAR|nr:hypothetical protein B4U79_17334 [Dinothrombium tinctorium]RWS13903.1 hypothetical protein B4U79_17327 [Dinothrombium tinctorium]